MLAALCCCFDSTDRDEATARSNARAPDRLSSAAYRPLPLATNALGERASAHLLTTVNARSDDAREESNEIDRQNVAVHARSTSAPPRGVLPRVFYELRDAASASASASAEDDERECDREFGKGEDGYHKRSASATIGASEAMALESIKREFARLTSSGRATRAMDANDAKEGYEGEDFDAMCPTCFEEYDPVENPRMTLKCGHHFHYACILEWQEYLGANARADTCPVCDAKLEFDD